MNIQIKNGKAFYEGLPVENFSLSWGHNISGLIEIIDDGKTWVVKDGTYPLPEGWNVVKEYFVQDNFVVGGWLPIAKSIYKSPRYKGRKSKITARLIRKEQKSIENCPTLFPCDCEGECMVLKSQNSAPTKEELRIEFNIKNPYVFILGDIHQHVDHVLRDKGMMNKDVSDAIMTCPEPSIMSDFLSKLYSKLLTYQQEIDRLKKELEKVKNI